MTKSANLGSASSEIIKQSMSLSLNDLSFCWDVKSNTTTSTGPKVLNLSLSGTNYNFPLLQVCRDKGVDCIVAPYEADAQLAFLNKSGIAQVVITEDSDLLLFGCDRVSRDVTGFMC